MTATKTSETVHCQQCGSTDYEDVGFEALREGDGYTACCNERAVYPRDGGCDPSDCYHLEDDVR